ncbi:hypothetical protein PM082_010121 [Marasmius tenuissimus]|nr:hypothetical protein PM082_010121 [Marasmius tenuissimus]
MVVVECRWGILQTVLKSIAEEEGDKDVKDLICAIVGLILASGKVTDSAYIGPYIDKTILRGLLNHLGYEVSDILPILRRLASVIEGVYSSDEWLVFYQKSFDDYMTDAERAGDWYIDVKGRWSIELAKSCVGIVHSDVFNNNPEIQDDLSFYTRSLWIHAFTQQFGQESRFPKAGFGREKLLEVLERGVFRWLYISTDRVWALRLPIFIQNGNPNGLFAVCGIIPPYRRHRKS